MERPSLCVQSIIPLAFFQQHIRERAVRWESSVLWRVCLDRLDKYFFCVSSHRPCSALTATEEAVCNPNCATGRVAVQDMWLSQQLLWGFIIHNTGRRYRISLIIVKMHTNSGRFQVSTLSTTYQIKSIRMQLRGEKNTFQWYLHHIQFKKSPLSSFQFKQTLDGTSTSDVFCTIWGLPGSQRLCNSTPTAARTTCFCKSKPDCSFCVSIWHPALKAGDTFNDNFRFLNRQKSGSRVPDICNIKTTASDELHCTTWPLLMTKHFQQNARRHGLLTPYNTPIKQQIHKGFLTA